MKTRFANNTSQTQRVKSTNVGFQGVTLVTPAEQWADYQNVCMTLPTSGRLHTTRFEAETIEPVDYEVTVKSAE